MQNGIMNTSSIHLSWHNSILTMLFSKWFNQSPPLASVVIQRGKEVVADFELEISNTIFRRSRGLMGRSSLGHSNGMLFIYPWPRIVRIWMAGTPLPLDVIFVDKTGQIIKIEPNMKPFSRKVVSSGCSVKWVMELAGGEAGRCGLGAGDFVHIALIRS